NHLNAVIVEIFVIILIVILGLFRDNAYFQIPSAASGILFFSMFIMFTGAFSYWLRGWAITTLMITLIVFNFLVKYQLVNSNYQAYGLDYNSKQAEYSLQRLNQLSSIGNYKMDVDSTKQVLENWKSKFKGPNKPKLILICTSGGGQRAAAWTMRTLQYTDSSLNGKLFNHTALITGASGGVVGASYFRQLYLDKVSGKNLNIYDQKYYHNITKDILNPVIFSLVVNDVFFRFQKFTYGKYEYLKDRGYAFEQQLNKNTEYVMNKKVWEYKEPEQQGRIPMIILAPTIVNDGRKLYISPQNVSYMTKTYTQESLSEKIKGIEFLRFYEEQDAKNLSYLSALRMSATFPYITPNVELPSDPAMEIMDAGLSDNYGIRDAVKFLYLFKDWIMENTSGVVLVSIRDSEKDKEIEKKVESSIFQKVFSPIGSLYSNWDYMQDLNNDNILEFAQTLYQGKMQMVEFQYIPNWSKLREKTTIDEKEAKDQERAALSWHLTTREKKSIQKTILEENNQKSLKKLMLLLQEEE
ncbi:MAG: patatin-like phospholipase family protein, partial [Cytophagaceae bacterium]|nr:patatin-like phospholipase family protein [Cytophagaceae bacterium]